MEFKHLKKIQNITENNLPSLKETTLAALELFIKEGLPKINFPKFKRPLIIGSGNAIVSAKILFENEDALFADENTYKNALKKNIDGVIIFSASGGKHAPIIAKESLKNKKKTFLITCTKNSQAEKILGTKNTIITPKNPEPYTYNTSTYMGWILAKTKEDPNKIYKFIELKIKPKLKVQFQKYNGFLLVTPNELAGVNQLFNVKFIELFGRRIARDVKSFEELKHAITVVPSKTEICLKFGKGKIDFIGKVLELPLPKNAGPATLMAIGYYVIGKIQEKNPQYFKENIKNYIKRNSKGSFGKALNIIVK